MKHVVSFSFAITFLVLLAWVPGPAVAEMGEPAPYAGLGVSNNSFSVDGAADPDDKIGFELFGGVDIPMHKKFSLGVEGGLIDYGFDDTLSLRLGVLPTFNFTPRAAAYGRFGLNYNFDASDVDPQYGLGGEYNFTHKFSGRLEWTRTDLDRGDLDTLQVSGVFHFG